MQKKHIFKRKPIEATNLLLSLMVQYFIDINKASKEKTKKIAWCSSMGPAEILHSFGFEIWYPENHAAMIGAKKMANDVMGSCHALGYSSNICSYLTSDIGAFLENKTPLADMLNINSIPAPDLLVYNTNQCRDVSDWFSWYADKLKVPIFGIDTGICNDGTYTLALQDYIINQLKDLIKKIENTFNLKFNYDRFCKSVKDSAISSNLWKKCLETNIKTPAPWTFWDQCIHMGPAVIMRGSEKPMPYYKTLLEELSQKAENKDGALEYEKYRIYWEGMPIWGKLSLLAKTFGENNANVSFSTYCHSWALDMPISMDDDNINEKKAFEAIAKAYFSLFITKNDNQKEKYIIENCKKFNLDGIVFHEAWTCPNNSNSRYGMPQKLNGNFNIPYLVLSGDLNDLRCFSEALAITNIEAFIEILEDRKN